MKALKSAWHREGTQPKPGNITEGGRGRSLSGTELTEVINPSTTARSPGSCWAQEGKGLPKPPPELSEHTPRHQVTGSRKPKKVSSPPLIKALQGFSAKRVSYDPLQNSVHIRAAGRKVTSFSRRKCTLIKNYHQMCW